jgi:predicted nucleic acid-binding protein
MLYFDASCLVRLYTKDAGWEKVRALAAKKSLACSLHGRAETVAAFHRKFRETSINQNELGQLLGEFERDCKAGAFDWLPLSPMVIERVTKAFANLPATFQLRAADAMHLASAAENSLKEIYSNDTRLLASAVYFGLNAINVI